MKYFHQLHLYTITLHSHFLLDILVVYAEQYLLLLYLYYSLRPIQWTFC